MSKNSKPWLRSPRRLVIAGVTTVATIAFIVAGI